MAHGCAIFLAHRSHHDNALSCYTSCRNRKRDLQMLQAVITKPSSAPEQSNSDGDAESRPVCAGRRDTQKRTPHYPALRASACTRELGCSSSHTTTALKKWPSISNYLDVTPETIRNLCRAGKIPGAWQVGRQWRIPREYLLSRPAIPDEKDDQQRR